MDDKNTTFELIERYLQGKLSNAELSDFEKRMKEDNSFSNEVEEQKLTHKALDVYSQLKTKERVKEIYQRESFFTKRKSRQMWSIAAGVAILVSGLIYISASMNYSNKAVLSEVFEPFPDRITTMGANANDQLLIGLKAYNDLDYEKATKLLSGLPDTIEQSNLVKLYLGISQLKTENVANAIINFQQLENAKNNFSEVARWYLALSYLKINDSKNCQKLLEQIVNEKSFQSENAILVLEKMNHPFRKLPGVR